MSKKFLKVLSVLLSISIFLTFAGCGKSSESETTTQQTQTGENKPQATEGKVYTIVWNGMQYGPVNNDAPVKKIMEEKFNVKFDLVYVDRTKYDELMNLKFANNEIPDVFTASNITILNQWVDQDLLAEVPIDFIRKNAPNITKELDELSKFDDKIWKYASVDGKNYALQACNLDSTYHNAVIWRDDWLKNVGITKTPEKLEEFEAALYKFKKDDPDKNGKDDTYGISQDGLNAIYGTSGYWPTYWNKKDNKIIWGGIQPEMKEILRMFNKWYKDGIIDPEFVTGENTGGYWAISHAFVNGKIGFTARGSYYHWNYPYYQGQSGGIGNYENFIKVQQPNASYVFGRPAIGANGKTGMSMGGVASNFAVFGKQLEKDQGKLTKILEILDTIGSDYDLYLTARFGVKGQNWDYTPQNEPKMKDEFKSNEAWASIGAHLTFMPWQSMTFFKKFQPYAFKFADQYVNYEKYKNEVSVNLPSYSKYKADLDKLQSQTYMKIITGDQPIDSYDTFVEQWKKSGGEQLTKEANDWYTNITKK